MKSFYLLFILLIPATLSTTPLILNLSRQDYFIGSNIEILEDKEGTLKIEDIETEAISSKFTPLKDNKDTINFGLNLNYYWIRLTVKNPDEDEFYLEIMDSFKEQVDFYWKNENGIWQKQSNGYRISYFNRDLQHFLPAFKIPRVKESTFYIFLKNDGIVWNIRILSEELFDNYYFYKNLLFGIIIGLLLFIIAHNLYHSILSKSRLYLIYSILSIQFLIFVSQFEGYLFLFWNLFLPFTRDNGRIIGVLSYSIQCILLLVYTILFFNIKKNSIAYKFSMVLIVYWTFYLLTFYHPHLSYIAGTIGGTIGLIFTIILSYQEMRKNTPGSRSFLWAYSLYLCFSILENMHHSFSLPYFAPLTYITFSSLSEILLLGLALTQKTNSEKQFLQKEFESAQARSLEAQRTLNSELEFKVIERTLELNQTLETFKQDLYIAKKIQQSTLFVNHSLIHELKITTKYSPILDVGGDFYCISKLNDTTYRIMLADATGHGLQAALITMAIKGIYDNIKLFEFDPSEILELFNNEYLNRYSSLGSFLTCILVDIDFENYKLKYASAGHPPAVLLKNDSEIFLKKTGRMIGIKKDTYTSHEFDFSKGDQLYLFTDGIFEQFNSSLEEYGEDRLYSNLRNNKNLNLDVDACIQLAIGTLYEFLRERPVQDDITIIGIEYP